MESNETEFLAQLFQLFDRDGSGFIESDEFFETQSMMALSFEDLEPANFAGSEVLCALDDNSDGRISWDEFRDDYLQLFDALMLPRSEILARLDHAVSFISALRRAEARRPPSRLPAGARLQQLIDAGIKELFRVYDTEGDGAISWSEYEQAERELLSGAGPAEETAPPPLTRERSTNRGMRASFRSMDVDGDNLASFEEFTARMEQLLAAVRPRERVVSILEGAADHIAQARREALDFEASQQRWRPRDEAERLKGIGIGMQPSGDWRSSKLLHLQAYPARQRKDPAFRKQLRTVLEPVADFFEPLGQPSPGDWLHELPEGPEQDQPFEDFAKRGMSCAPDATKRRIYLLPVGPPLKWLQQMIYKQEPLVAAWFGRPVRVLKNVQLKQLKRQVRKTDGQRNGSDLLLALRGTLPRDAMCLLAVTSLSLHGSGSTSFVNGVTSRQDRIGVVSLAHLDPELIGGDKDRALRVRRLCRSVTRGLCRLIGLGQCTYFRCLCQSNNTIPELDGIPLALCPVCLRKLQWATGFDPFERYRRLHAVLSAEAALAAEASWMQRRIDYLEGALIASTEPELLPDDASDEEPLPAPAGQSGGVAAVAAPQAAPQAAAVANGGDEPGDQLERRRGACDMNVFMRPMRWMLEPPPRVNNRRANPTLLKMLNKMQKSHEWKIIRPQGKVSAVKKAHPALPRDQVLSLFRRETELRCNPEWQQLFTLDNNRNLRIINELQRQTLREHGLPANRAGLYLMHAQRYHYRDDAEIREAGVFMRYDDCRQGQLVQTVDAPIDVTLVCPDNPGEFRNLLDFQRPGRPLVVLAGSCT